MQDKYFTIFGGGGVRGISYCGAYKALRESGIEFSGYAGSSIGAVFAVLISIGYTYEEIYEIFINTGFDLFIDINVGFTKEIAFSKGNIFYDWIKEKIEKKFYGDNYKKGQMKEVCFCDIKENLIIFSTDITNMKFKEFSCAKTPDFEIAKAVRASVSMPGLFSPVEIDGALVVDGDLLKGTPLWRVSDSIKNLKERIIEFRLEDNESKKDINNSLDYINRVYNAICGFATDYIIDLYGSKDKFDYIKINTDDIGVVDFLISKERKKDLFDKGYETTKEYFTKYLPQKKTRLKNIYSKLLGLIIAFQKEFVKTNIVNSYLKLCEIFMFLCEEKKDIDSEIYDLILKFKNEYLSNYKNIDFIFFKKATVLEKEELSKLLIQIIKITTQKTN